MIAGSLYTCMHHQQALAGELADDGQDAGSDFLECKQDALGIIEAVSGRAHFDKFPSPGLGWFYNAGLDPVAHYREAATIAYYYQHETLRALLPDEIYEAVRMMEEGDGAPDGPDNPVQAVAGSVAPVAAEGIAADVD